MMVMMVMVIRRREPLLHHPSSVNIAYRGKLGIIQSRVFVYPDSIRVNTFTK